MAIAGRWYLIDPILSIAIGLFVNWSAYRLVRDAVDVLLETVPAGIDAEGVGRAMAECGGVRGVHDLHIWTITSGLHALSAHVVVDSKDLSASDAVLTEVKQLLERQFRIAHSTIQIESREWEHVGHSCTHEPKTI
jgi:cobalt-zinc-cadmium efflux system protein